MANCIRFKTAVVALLAACALLSACSAKPTCVLFLGNSITYVGNLPAVLEALCTSSNRRCAVEMIAGGGATLKQRVDDGTLEKASKTRRFDYVVLQERGGDYIALPAQRQIQQEAEEAAENLSAAARALGLKPVLLGTYQGYSTPSKRLVAAERALASRLNVPIVSVSNRFLCGKERYPDLRWLDSDGLHPGPELTLLMAVLLFRDIFGVYPEVPPAGIQVPIYDPRNRPQAASPSSSQPVPAGTPASTAYDTSAISSVVETARTCAGDA